MEGGAGATRRWLIKWSTCVYIALAAFSFSPSAAALKQGNNTDNYSCYVAPAVPEDRRVNKTRLRIVTYNAEVNLIIRYMYSIYIFSYIEPSVLGAAFSELTP
jgi:hypothetical protein